MLPEARTRTHSPDAQTQVVLRTNHLTASPIVWQTRRLTDCEAAKAEQGPGSIDMQKGQTQMASGVWNTELITQGQRRKGNA
jgi:hypothetical protein